MSHTRAQGIEFGEFADRLATETYPTTAESLVGAHGDLQLSLAAGEESVADVLGGVDEEFADAEAVRQAVYGLVGIDAIGRKRYTDRDPPTPGEVAAIPPVSF